MCGLVEHRAQQGVATFGYSAVIVDLAGLVALRRQADMCADRPRVDEALRLVDRRSVGQGNDRTDPGGSHQPSAHWVVADRVEQHLVQDGELLAHDPADVEQWLGDRGQPRKALTSSRTRASYRPLLTTPTFKPKLRNVPRRSDSTSSS